MRPRRNRRGFLRLCLGACSTAAIGRPAVAAGAAPGGRGDEPGAIIAVRRNVFCKVSGLVEGTGRTDGTAPREAAFYRPVLDVLWGAFGPDRLLFGSNWPVSERFASFATVCQIVNDYVADKAPGALRKVFSANARAVYQWPDCPAASRE